MDAVDPSALVAAAMAATPMSWLEYDGGSRPRPVWHVWHGDAGCVVSGGDEQPLPGVDRAAEVRVTVRSKDSGTRLLTWVAQADVLVPESPAWSDAVDALAAARLNVPGGAASLRDTWAARCVVTRLVPTGRLVESPGAMSDGSHATPPPPTPVTTRGALPRVVHRRPTASPPL